MPRVIPEIACDASPGSVVSSPGVNVIDKGIVTWNGTDGTLVQDSGVRLYGKSATDPALPAPGDGDLYYNTSLNMLMEYDSSRSKWLTVSTDTIQIGRNNATDVNQYYRGIDGRIMSDIIGYPAFNNGTIIGFAYTRSDIDAATFEIVEGGVVIETVASSALSGTTNILDGDFTAGGVIAVKNSNAGNITSDVQAWIRIKWRI